MRCKEFIKKWLEICLVVVKSRKRSILKYLQQSSMEKEILIELIRRKGSLNRLRIETLFIRSQRWQILKIYQYKIERLIFSMMRRSWITGLNNFLKKFRKKNKNYGDCICFTRKNKNKENKKNKNFKKQEFWCTDKKCFCRNTKCLKNHLCFKVRGFLKEVRHNILKK